MYIDHFEDVTLDHTGVWKHSDGITDYFFKWQLHRLDGPASYDNTCKACGIPEQCYCYYDYYIRSYSIAAKSTILLLISDF